jgi:large subunit ribosomal protein L20
MPRSTNSPASRKRRKRVIRAAKGFRGFRSKLYRYAKDAVRKAMQYHYRDRKNRKREFRGLWIQRVNSGARAHGLSYARFMEGLKAAGIELDRKVLADIAVNDDAAFQGLVQQSLKALEKKGVPLRAPAKAA